ncbi:MAG: transglutaminase domain-containing protein [Deltaproteobacteria bacterium]|nr:transglutaminase domain-containing protein [Deltaproteobacteria bacterium]
MEFVEQVYLKPTSIIDSDHPDIIAYAREASGESQNLLEKAVRIYYAVRDDIRYDPYCPFYLPEHYRASNVLKSGRGYCVCKASLLCALGRSLGIPSRVGFATVRNHLATKQMLEFMGSDLFVYHGYTDFFLNGKWVKATPAFNKELCERHKVAPLEFNGLEDSVFQPYNSENHLFMEYTEFSGTYADIPVEVIVAAWEKAYGRERVQGWIKGLEDAQGIVRNFYQEEVV